jgi:predicted mannosyl-3-phosphoglycerate phosphatase (HAD superfamily)
MEELKDTVKLEPISAIIARNYSDIIKQARYRPFDEIGFINKHILKHACDGDHHVTICLNKDRNELEKIRDAYKSKGFYCYVDVHKIEIWWD